MVEDASTGTKLSKTDFIKEMRNELALRKVDISKLTDKEVLIKYNELFNKKTGNSKPAYDPYDYSEAVDTGAWKLVEMLPSSKISSWGARMS